jgi:hypothetical protein
MLSKFDLEQLAKARLEDAEELLKANRLDGAAYLCGYAVELGLKLRICKTLDWDGFPSTSREFENAKSFRVHDLDILLHLSGYEKIIKAQYLSEWLGVNQWNPESRYIPVGQLDKKKVENMIASTVKLLKIL